MTLRRLARDSASGDLGTDIAEGVVDVAAQRGFFILRSPCEN
jgi:hypothetical protein